jgi:hypothetical protein
LFPAGSHSNEGKSIRLPVVHSIRDPSKLDDRHEDKYHITRFHHLVGKFHKSLDVQSKP